MPWGGPFCIPFYVRLCRGVKSVFLHNLVCSVTVPASLSLPSLLRQGPGSQGAERVLPGLLQAAEAGEAARRPGLFPLDPVQPLSHRREDVHLRQLRVLCQQGSWLLQSHPPAARGRPAFLLPGSRGRRETGRWRGCMLTLQGSATQDGRVWRDAWPELTRGLCLFCCCLAT